LERLMSTVADISTHHIVLDFGKHAGTLLTRVPVSYLRWMANQQELPPYTSANGPVFQWRTFAKAELARRGTTIPKIEISGHAIDSASLRCRKIWHETALSAEEGLHSWLQRVTLEAIERGHIEGDADSGAYFHIGIKFVVEAGEEFPVLKTVMPSNKAANA